MDKSTLMARLGQVDAGELINEKVGLLEGLTTLLIVVFVYFLRRHNAA